MKSKAVTALAALLAAFGGVAAYVAAKDHRLAGVLIALGIAIMIGLVCLVAGATLIGSHPRPAVLLMSLWIVAIIGIGAGIVALFLWLGLELPNWLTSGKPTNETQEISKVLLGALTAYTGVLFTEDLDKGKGSLWPSARTKTALGKAYASRGFAGKTRHYQAVYEDRVRSSADSAGDGIDGWGLVARWKRARVLATRYDEPPVTSATVAVTVTVKKSGSPLTTALVAYAGNYGPKTPVDGNGQITFQVLPGTNSFTAWDGSAYTTQTLTVTTAATTTISVT